MTKVQEIFQKYQLAGLTNLGTAFGMGLIVVVTMSSVKVVDGGSVALAVIVGVIGAIIGSVLATRLMLHKSAKLFGKDAEASSDGAANFDVLRQREVRQGGAVQRFSIRCSKAGQAV